MKHRKKWRPGGRPRQQAQPNGRRSKHLLKEMVRSQIPGKGEQTNDANLGVHTADFGEHRRPAA